MARDYQLIDMKNYGESSRGFENTARVNFLCRKVWCLKSEVQCLNCGSFTALDPMNEMSWEINP
jgi:hypothetical protein